MAITLVQSPQEISFSRNPIIFKLQSDARIESAGTYATGLIEFSDTITEGTVVIIRRAGMEVRLTAKNSPKDNGFEFPAGEVSPTYMETILPYFQNNFYLNRDYDISVIGDTGHVPPLTALQLIAKHKGAEYDIVKQSIPGVSVKPLANSVPVKVKPNFCIWLELWVVENATPRKIFSEPVPTDDTGTVEWDLRDFLHPELAPDIHNWDNEGVHLDAKSTKAYYIRYAEAWGEKLQVGKILTSSTYHVLLGGTPYKDGAGQTVLDILREDEDKKNDRILRIGPDARYVFPDEPQFITFLNQRAIHTDVKLKVVAKYAFTGTEITKDITVGELPRFAKVTANVGYGALGLHELITDKLFESYTVQFFDGANPISRKYTYYVNYQEKPYRRYFIYLNSLGAFDTLTTWGKQSSEIDYVKQTANKYLSPNYDLPEGTYVDWDIRYRQRFEVATGYRYAGEVRNFQDFYRSRWKYRYYQGQGLPITILNNSIRQYQDGDTLIAQSFEYTYNYDDDSYSEEEESDITDLYAPPAGFVGGGGASPIVVVPPAKPGTSEAGELLWDNAPVEGSSRAVRSGGIYTALQAKQDKLSLGTAEQYRKGDHTLGNFEADVTDIVNNILEEFEISLPEWVTGRASGGRIESSKLDWFLGSGIYTTVSAMQEDGWPKSGRTGLIRTVSGNSGSRVGYDLAITEDLTLHLRQLDEANGNSNWVEIGNGREPELDDLPPINFAVNQWKQIAYDITPYIADATQNYKISLINYPEWIIDPSVTGLTVYVTGQPPKQGSYALVFELFNTVTKSSRTFSIPIRTGAPTSVIFTLWDTTTNSPIGNISQSAPFSSYQEMDSGDILLTVNGDHNYVKLRLKGTDAGSTIDEELDWTLGENATFGTYRLFESGETLPDGTYILYAVVKLGTVTLIDTYTYLTLQDSGALPLCAHRPVLLNVKNITPSSLSFEFYGEEVWSIAWRILDESENLVRSGTVAPTDFNPGHTPGISFDTLPAGSYILEIEGASCSSGAGGPSRMNFSITAAPETIVTIVPDWLKRLGLSYDHNSHEASFWMEGSTSLQLKITGRNSTPHPSGIGWGGVVWNSTTYITGTTEWVSAPWTQVVRSNPATNGTGGMLPGGEYTLYFRREGTTEPVFAFDITMPASSQGITEIPLSDSNTPTDDFKMAVVTHIVQIVGGVEQSAGFSNTLDQDVMESGLYQTPASPHQWLAIYFHGQYPDLNSLSDFDVDYVSRLIEVQDGESWTTLYDTGVPVGPTDTLIPMMDDYLTEFENIPELRQSNTFRITFVARDGGSSGTIVHTVTRKITYINTEEDEVPFENLGVRVATVAGRVYRWIPSENMDMEVLPDGKIKLIAPATKTAFQGSNTCKRFLVGDFYDNPISEDIANALFGDGLMLPPDNYGFRCLYVNANSFEEIRLNLWDKTGQSENGPKNCAGMESIKLSITSISDPAVIGGDLTKVVVPKDLLQASWLPHYQLLPYNLNLPPGKVFGTTRVMMGMSAAQLLQKITHLQWVVTQVDGVPRNNRWRNIQALNHQGALATPTWIINDAILDLGFISMSEMNENWGNHGWPLKAEEVFEGIYERMKNEKGVTSPSQTWLIADYFDALYGYNLEFNFRRYSAPVLPYADLSMALFNVDVAKKRQHDSSIVNCAYFTHGAVNYRNILIGGYLGNHFFTFMDDRFYGTIFNLEKIAIAAPGRRVLRYGWHSAEGLGLSRIDVSGVYTRLKLDGGDIMRSSAYDWPLHTMLNESFWTLLLGNAYILWNSAIVMNPNPENFEVSWFGGYDAWKTKWQPTDGVAVTYNPSDPTHPPFLREGLAPHEGIFPEITLQGETGAWIGAWLYSQISGVSDRVSEFLEYCPFSYVINAGTTQAGYYNGNTPKNGAQGNARLNTATYQNLGQDNIVKSYEAKKPVCIYTRGADGDAIIFQHPFANLTDEISVTTTYGGITRTFNAIGNRLHIFLVND